MKIDLPLSLPPSLPSAHPLLLSKLDGRDLLCNDRENFNVDAVELVKARPGPRAGQALEELGHCHEVKLVRTVEHHTLNRHCLGQILVQSFGGMERREINTAAQIDYSLTNTVMYMYPCVDDIVMAIIVRGALLQAIYYSSSTQPFLLWNKLIVYI